MKILFITATRIGDAVLSTGVLSELVRRYPGARITVACGPLAQSLFRGFPSVERIVVLDKKPFAGHWFKLWTEVRHETWDLTVDLRRSLAPFGLKAARRLRLGPTDQTVHRAQFLPRVLGLDDVLEPMVPVPERHRKSADNLIPDGMNVLAVAPIAARPEKTWPIDRFADLVRIVSAPAGPCAGWACLIVAGPGDGDAVKPMIDSVPPGRLLRLIGEPDLLTVAAALMRCRAYVGNDSGITHLAAAVGVPTLALFGPTESRHYAPRGRSTRVLEAYRGDGARTMQSISVEAVAGALAAMIGGLG